MILKSFSSPDEFAKEVCSGLFECEAMNGFCLASINSFLAKGKAPYMRAVWDGPNLMGVLVCNEYLDRMNLAPSYNLKPEVAHLLLNDFLKLNLPISNLVGDAKTVTLFEAGLKRHGLKTQVQLSMILYKCTKVIFPPKPKDVVFRRARQEDVPVLANWIHDFMQEAVPNDPPIDSRQHAQEKVAKGLLYVLENEKRIVTMIAKARDLNKTCSINLVYTPPDLRKMGYASFATATFTQMLIESGKHEVNLFTDKVNAVSNKIYQNIGYEVVCDFLNVKCI